MAEIHRLAARAARFLNRRAFLRASAALGLLPVAAAAQLVAPSNLSVHAAGGPVWIKPFPPDLLRFFHGQPKTVDITQYVTGAVNIVLVGPPLPPGITFNGRAFVYDGVGDVSGFITGLSLVADDGGGVI